MYYTLTNNDKIEYLNKYLNMISSRYMELENELVNPNNFPEKKYRDEAQNILIDLKSIESMINNEIINLTN